MEPENIAGRIGRTAMAWVFLLVSSVFFFGPGAEYCANLVAHMFSLHLIGDGELKMLARGEQFLYALLATLIFHLFEERPAWFTRARRYENWLLPGVAFAVVIAVSQYAGTNNDFFYFQF